MPYIALSPQGQRIENESVAMSPMSGVGAWLNKDFFATVGE